jgi:hypothetical protein
MCGEPWLAVATPGGADATRAMVEAHTALLNTLLVATDFLHGEGLPCIPL